MKTIRDVKVWRQAHRLTVSVYRATAGFASSDPTGITGEIRRSCSSLSTNLLSANLGQVSGRRTDPEFVVHMRGALTSAAELESRLDLARDLQILPEEEWRKLGEDVAGVRKTITSYLRSIGPDRFR